jgi:hypothetical protein
MWQGQQVKLTNAGQECDAQIALGVGDQAVCYTAADGSLKCAGLVYTSNFGPNFTTVPDRVDAEQIFISPTFNSSTGNAMCVRQGDGTLWCMGDRNDWGQFGGVVGPTSSFVQWGGRNDVSQVGTGTWDQMCALTTSGLVLCSGNGFGVNPMSVGFSSNGRFVVTTTGQASIDDPSLWRAASRRGPSWSFLLPAAGLLARIERTRDVLHL